MSATTRDRCDPREMLRAWGEWADMILSIVIARQIHIEMQ